MSGFEIAGLVLGAIPVAITAMDSYKKASRQFKFWRDIREKHMSFSDDLDAQRCTFELNLKLLLLPMIVDDAKINTLLANPNGAEWKSEETEEALKTRLAGSYTHYVTIVKGLLATAQALEKELALKPPPDDPQPIQGCSSPPALPHRPLGRFSRHFSREHAEYQNKRLKLSFDQGSTVKILLDELTQRNGQLEKLLKQTDRVTRITQERERGTLLRRAANLDAAIVSFCNKATALYNVLQNTWSNCSCSPAGKHLTNVLLEHWAAAEAKEHFYMTFAISESATTWKLRKAVFRMGEREKAVAAQGPEVIVLGGTATHQPAHRQGMVPKSAMRTSSTSSIPNSSLQSSAVSSSSAAATPRGIWRAGSKNKYLPTIGSLAAATINRDTIQGDGIPLINLLTVQETPVSSISTGVVQAGPSAQMASTTSVSLPTLSSSTIQSTIPSTIPSTITSTITSTIPSTITSTIPSTITSTIPSSTNSSSGQTAAASDIIITNLCDTFRDSVPSKEQCAGFLNSDYDGGSEAGKYYLYPEGKQIVTKRKFVTLHELMNEDKLPPLRFQQRLSISLALASSFVKLLESPWIPQCWTKEDITFFQNPEDPGVLLLENPHVRGPPVTQEEQQPGDEQPECDTGRGMTREDKRLESLMQLGIVLEELCFRCTIEKRLAQRGSLAPRSRQERLEKDRAEGMLWMREIEEEMYGKQFGEAVEWCLAGSCKAGSDATWRSQMLTHVVWPLEQAWRDFKDKIK